MAQLAEQTPNRSKRNFKKKNLRVDLTPMVDLGFLLITFFILTTALSQPTVARLIMPKDSPASTPVKNNTVLTLMLTRNDSIQYYEGNEKSLLYYCTFADLRSVIQNKKRKVGKILSDPAETIIILYPGDKSTYKNFMDVLDEIEINNVSHYFIMN